MKIAIIGYGKMGKEIESLALLQGHEISGIYDIHNISELKSGGLNKAHVAIEFTSPNSAPDNILACLDAGVPVVSGSTGWTGRIPEIQQYCKQKNGCVFLSSNFSIGMNVFFEINKSLSRLLSKYKNYHATINETHHIHKLDKPSGTAVVLANDIIENSPNYVKWMLNSNDNVSVLPVYSFRKGEITGEHEIEWKSECDEILIKHTAYNRQGFALGALMAAEFCIGKNGVLGMNDLLKS